MSAILLERVPELHRLVCEALVNGSAPDDIMAELMQGGADLDSASAAVQAVVSNPLFAIARTLKHRLQARDWLLLAQSASQATRGRPAFVDVDKSISREDFLREYFALNEALYQPGVANGWSAIKKWNREYLSSSCGSEMVEVMANRTAASISEQNTANRLRTGTSFGDYIDRVYDGGVSNDYYMVSRNTFFERGTTRRLFEDLGGHAYVNTRAANDRVKMWFGPKGTITPLHYDDKNNYIVQIVGKKTVRLYRPEVARHMKQPHHWYAGQDPLAESNNDSERLGEIRLTLSPGDGLFIPVGWWHALEALDVSITLSFIDFGVPNEYSMPS